MNENTYTCSKCHSTLPVNNKIMHDLHCQVHADDNVTIEQNRSSPNYKQESQTKSAKSTPLKTSTVEDLYYCPKCNNYMVIAEKNDHMLSHQYEEGGMENEEDQIQAQNQMGMPNIETSAFNNMGRTSNSMTETVVERDLPGGGKMITKTVRDANGNVISTMTQTISGGSNINSNIQSFGGDTQNFGNVGFDDNFFMTFNDFGNMFASSRMFNPMIRRQFGDMRMMNFNQLVAQAMGQVPDTPVSDEIINELPEFEIDNLNKIPADKRECVICMSSFQVGEKALFVPCMHIFHSECIKNWFKTRNTCPICKFKLDNTQEEGDSGNNF